MMRLCQMEYEPLCPSSQCVASAAHLPFSRSGTATTIPGRDPSANALGTLARLHQVGQVFVHARDYVEPVFAEGLSPTDRNVPPFPMRGWKALVADWVRAVAQNRADLFVRARGCWLPSRSAIRCDQYRGGDTVALKIPGDPYIVNRMTPRHGRDRAKVAKKPPIAACSPDMRRLQPKALCGEARPRLMLEL